MTDAPEQGYQVLARKYRPATFADLDPDLGSAGIAWGAAKAHVILARRRSEGRR